MGGDKLACCLGFLYIGRRLLNPNNSPLSLKLSPFPLDKWGDKDTPDNIKHKHDDPDGKGSAFEARKGKPLPQKGPDNLF